MAIGLAAFYIAAPDSDFFDLFSFIRIDLRSLRLLLNGSLLYYFLSIANISRISSLPDFFVGRKFCKVKANISNCQNFLKLFFVRAPESPWAASAAAAFLKSECKGSDFWITLQII